MNRPSRSSGWRQCLAWRPGGFARGSLHLLYWLLARAAMQVVLVIALARGLGARQYGEFVAAVAIATFVTPLAGAGLHAVLLRDGARQPHHLSTLVGDALRIWSLGFVVAWICGIVAAWLLLPPANSLAAITLLVGGEIAAGSLIELFGRFFQARQKAPVAGALQAGLALSRLAGLGLLMLFGPLTVAAWMVTYFGVSVAYTLGVFIAVDGPRLLRAARPGVAWGLAREGAVFAGGAFAFRIQIEVNKPILAQLGYALAANFNAAQRAMDIASLPLVALQENLWPRVYSSAEPRRELRRIGTAVLLLALAGGVVLTLVSGLLPRVLGPGFADTSRTLMFLAWLPALQSLRNIGNTALVAAGESRHMVWVYIVGATSSISFNLLMIPAFGLSGAAAAAYGAELATVAAQWMLHRMRAGSPRSMRDA